MARYPQIEKALAELERSLRVRGRSRKTVATYRGVVRRFLFFHRRPNPELLEEAHLRQYLVHLTEDRRVATGTRNQAASALTYFYREVLGKDIGAQIKRAKTGGSVPVFFSHAEATAVIGYLEGKYRLAGALLYGTGVRLSECLSLRLKDLDFDLRQITVRNGKGAKDRFTVLPMRLRGALRDQIRNVLRLHANDRAGGAGWAALPFALHRKNPRAGYEPGWQFLFPSSRLSRDPTTGRRGRHHLHPTAVQRNIKRAIHEAGITKPASTHTFRHSFATQVLRNGGTDLRTLQDILGHKDPRVTNQYMHAVQNIGLNVTSPIDLPDPTP